MSDTAIDLIRVEIDLTTPFLENARKIIQVAIGQNFQTEEHKINLFLGLSSMVENLYREAWTTAMVPLDRSGLSTEKIEEFRLAILFGAWVEVVETIKPGVFELVKKEQSVEGD